MSLATALSEAVAFQVRFYNREDSELKAKREALWAEVESEIERLIDKKAHARPVLPAQRSKVR